MDHAIARQLVFRTRFTLGNVFDERRPVESVLGALGALIERDVLDSWFMLLEENDWTSFENGGPREVVEMLSVATRRKNGMFMTPSFFADAMACVVDPDELVEGSAVLDLSAGSGALLAAMIRNNPRLRAVGVERNRALAIAAALAVYEARNAVGGGGQDYIYVGDGLSKTGGWTGREGGYEVVVGNPPYVGEKGNVALFAGLKESHPHLAAYFGARIDLLYLFFHRGLDFLAPGGQLIYLTSEYWLTASGAAKLRQDLADRGRPELFVTFGSASIFKDAPGHHSLLSVFRGVGAADRERSEGLDKLAWALRVGDCGVGNLKEIVEEVCRGKRMKWADVVGRFADVEGTRVVPEVLREQGWAPFVDSKTVCWANDLRSRGSLLGELGRDQQGFVSGADRVTRAHLERFDWGEDGVAAGDPIFMFDESEIPRDLEPVKDRLFLPVLRGSLLRANQVLRAGAGTEYVLYLDGNLSDSDEVVVARHLGKFKALLELRREVRSGAMAWYRLHWPRRRKDFEGPKLVVARRAPGPCFSLDLSGSAISSDCTYIVAPVDVQDPVRYLASLMVVLNGGEVGRYLAAFGKRKGTQLEFYADPLRALPLGVRRVGGDLVVIDGLWEGGSQSALEEQVNALLGRTEEAGALEGVGGKV